MLGSAPEWKKLITFVQVSPRGLNFKAITFNDNESQTLALFALFSFVCIAISKSKIPSWTFENSCACRRNIYK